MNSWHFLLRMRRASCAQWYTVPHRKSKNRPLYESRDPLHAYIPRVAPDVLIRAQGARLSPGRILAQFPHGGGQGLLISGRHDDGGALVQDFANARKVSGYNRPFRCHILEHLYGRYVITVVRDIGERHEECVGGFLAGGQLFLRDRSEEADGICDAELARERFVSRTILFAAAHCEE